MKFSSLVACCAATLALPALSAQTTIFSENFGTPSATTGVDDYTGYQNHGTLTFFGTADVRTSTTSNNYAGASGSGNVFLTGSGASTFSISGINTSGYQAGTINLTFGAYKSAILSTMSDLLVLEYSSDGINYTALSIPAQATGSGTANWRSITLAATSLPATSSLSLRWRNTGTTSQFRLDDVTLTGSAIPEPSTYAACTGIAVIGFAAWRRRRKRNASQPNR